MSTVSLPPLNMPPAVRRKISALRVLVRLYVGLEGMATVVVVWGLTFWLGLLLDWTWEPSPLLRGVAWGLWLLLTFYVAVRYLVLRTLAHLPATSLALLLERYFPELDESLITTVEAATPGASPGNPTLLQQTSQQAAAAVADIPLRKIFQLRPLIIKLLLALLLVGSVTGFAWARTEAFGFWLQRLQLSQTPWPRRVDLSVLGFRPQGGELVAKVARDADFDLQVLASIEAGHTAPQQVELRYRLADGRHGRYTMTKVGTALPGRDVAQEFRYLFPNLTEDVWFDVVGGDDRLYNLRLHVVERPRILQSEVEVQYPSYLQRQDQNIPFRGRVALPEGCHTVFHIVATKPLQAVTVHDAAEQRQVAVTRDQENPSGFAFPLRVGSADRVLLISLQDHDGVENREPDRLVVAALADEPPEVRLHIPGVGTALTPQARIPWAGEITDEYGTVEIWYELQIDGGPLRRMSPTAQPAGRQVFRQLEALDLAELDTAYQRTTDTSSALKNSGDTPQQVPAGHAVTLQPGQKLALGVVARDAYDLQDAPHVGASRRWLFDVVTASELRALLEKRELALRQRFEALYEKMVSIQELLERIDTTVGAAAQHTPQRTIDRDQLRIGGALQNVTQLAYETTGVSAAFRDLVTELVNNRVDTEELKNRLLVGIAAPLQELGEVQMPILAERIQDLQTAHTDRSGLPAAQRRALAEAELVVAAMQRVLERMLELESYNELVELLRGIVREHGQVQEQTRQQRRARLRRLLEED